MRTCVKCKIEKDESEFSFADKSKTYLRTDCKVCKNQKNLECYHTNPEKARRRNWKKKYNGSVEQEEHYMNATHCDLCGREFTCTTEIHQDHNHYTGEVNAVLCCNCNMIEGKVKHDPEILIRIYNYIKEKYS